MKLRQVMLLPSLGCQAQCGYCFGPRWKALAMTQETLEAVINWVKDSLEKQQVADSIAVVFHGGEPLLAGEAFYDFALLRLREVFGDQRLRLGIQSNLWLLSDELCELFVEHHVSLGTSLDGPQEINDAQRGQGYFRRTMAGIEQARHHGLNVGCICTFTPQSAPHYREIFDFFVRERLDFSIHAAVPALNFHFATQLLSPAPLTRAPEELGISASTWSLSPEAYGDLLVNLLDLYLANLNRVQINTLDTLCRSISAGEGGVCTFRNCLGQYLAIAPDGAIYPCQRFVGHPAFCLGTVQDRPTWEQLEQSPAWRLLHQREEQVKEECGNCPNFAHCKGGCPYDALAAKGGYTGRDPYCPAYRHIFTTITDRALEEVFSEANLNEVIADPTGGTLLRRGPLLTLMRGGPHPADITRRARELVAAVAMAISPTPEEAANRLNRAGLVTRHEQAVASLAALRRRLATKPTGLLNLYLHVSYACNLRCSHCYAGSGPDHRLLEKTLSVDEIVRLMQEAATLGFRKAVITGGEPLLHPERDHLLDALADWRETVKPLQTVLRTNLAVSLNPVLLQRLAHSTDQVVVSVDGDRVSHDARRGTGNYDRAVANLRALIQASPSAEIVLAAVLSAEHAAGAAGQAVKALAQELGGLTVRFKPLLPLGRARQSEHPLKPDGQWTALKTRETLVYGFRPSTTCGIGYSLYVGPEGETYPCYALMGQAYALGNVRRPEGLRAVIESDRYRALSGYTVDTNRQCRQCALRYLCGGGCRAWNNLSTATPSRNLDDPPADCRALFGRARALLNSALETLEVPPKRWLAAGLPLPEPESIHCGAPLQSARSLS